MTLKNKYYIGNGITVMWMDDGLLLSHKCKQANTTHEKLLSFHDLDNLVVMIREKKDEMSSEEME